MEGGREQDNQPDKGQDENGSQKQKDQEKKAPEIPEIGFKEITNDDGEEDIIMTQEYFAAAASIYQMTRDPRHLYVTRRSIIDQEARFNDEVFPPEFMRPIDDDERSKKEDKEIKMGEFINRMIEAKVSQEVIEK